MMKYKASVSVYLAMCLGIFTMLITTLVTLSINNGIRSRIAGWSNVVMNSVLGEYSIALKDKYDLFYIDTSYLSATPSVENLKERLNYYLFQNTSKIQNNNYWGTVDDSEAEVISFRTATANMGASMRAQAGEVVDRKIGGVSQEVNEVCSNEGFLDTDNTDYLNEWMNLMESIEGMELPKEYNEETLKMEEVELINPAKWVYQLSQSDISYVSSISTSSVSSSKSNILNGPSGLSVNTDYDENIKECSNNKFIEYLIHYMHCYTDNLNDSLINLQLEYIYAGKDNDYENFTEIVNEIFMLRCADNFSCALSDGGLLAQAINESSAIKVCILDPKFIMPVAKSMVYAAAYLETVNDMYSIFNNGKVELIKATHNYSIVQVLSGSFELNLCNEGFSYRQYLIYLLCRLPVNTINLRTMDIMELQIKDITQNPNFSMDWCMERITIQFIYHYQKNKELLLEREYGYF